MNTAFTLLIQPCGFVEFTILKRLVEVLSEKFVSEIDVSTENLTPPLTYYNWLREQYHAGKVLDWIYEKIRYLGYDRVLAVCGFDAYVEPLNFVFGLADPFKGIAAVFLPRLRPEFYGFKPNVDRYFERLVKECMHELGHTFGLEHCRNRKCVMSFSNSVIDVDHKLAAFCLSCSSKLKGVGIQLGSSAILPQ